MKQELVRQQQAVQTLDVDIVIHQYKQIQKMYDTLMQSGVHYGSPFPGSDKPTLLKPGAELLQNLYQLNIKSDVEVHDLGNDHREYVVHTRALHRASGLEMASGEGSASTKESKFRYRYAELKCPECGKETIIKGKEQYGGGWLCYKKKGGCGAKFQEGNKSIEQQDRGKVENPDIADLYNTVLKMAKKRSMVDCILSATGASSFFTQDAEDYVKQDFGETRYDEGKTIQVVTHNEPEDDELFGEREEPKKQSVPQTIQQKCEAEAQRLKGLNRKEYDLYMGCNKTDWTVDNWTGALLRLQQEIQKAQAEAVQAMAGNVGQDVDPEKECAALRAEIVQEWNRRKMHDNHRVASLQKKFGGNIDTLEDITDPAVLQDYLEEQKGKH